MLADRNEQKPIRILYNKTDREALTQDVLNIKRDAYFKPNYVIASKTKTTQQRPQEFEGGFEQWLYDVKASHIKSLEENKLKEKKKEQWLMIIETRFAPQVMKRFLKVE